MDTEDNFTGPVNTGNPGEFTIKELAEKILELTNSHSVLEYKSLPHDDPTQRKPDITLAQGKLGWTLKVGLEEGLLKTIEYFHTSFLSNDIFSWTHFGLLPNQE